MKKIICLLLSLILIIGFLSSCRYNQNKIIDSGAESESSDDTQISSLNTENTEPILTETPAEDFEYRFSKSNENAIITKYIGTSKDVIIPSKIEGRTVTSLLGYQVDDILHGVFQGTEIETVVIPETVIAMAGRTFMDCTFLSSVTIKPNSVLREIGNQAFRNCSSLKTINLEDAKNLKSIGSFAFNNCNSIERIILPENLESIGLAGFSECASLKSINVPSKLNLMPNDLGLRITDLPTLEEIRFDDGRQIINGYIYFGMSSDVNIIIPSSVNTIEMDVFGNSDDGHVNLYFLGDCPQFIYYEDRFPGYVTIYYDPNTNGWDTTPLKEVYTLIPII